MEMEIEKKVLGVEGLRRVEDVRDGALLAVWLELGVGFAENTVRVSHALVGDGQSEAVDRVHATIQWAEGFLRSGFEILRGCVGASDVLGRDAASRVSRAALATVGAFDRAGNDLQAVTSRAIVGVVGTRSHERAQA